MIRWWAKRGVGGFRLDVVDHLGKDPSRGITVITETITVNFKEARHGIIRTIPLTNEVRRLDGTSYTNHARISNIYCDTLFSTHRSNNNYEIKIGDPTETMTGDKTYVIRYTYALGWDKTSEYDELYFNIIGNQWDTIVMNVSFTIQMPKDFDTSKLGFSSGPRGSTDSSRVKYNINGTTITGTLDGHLLPGHGLTVRCELPEGYFVPDIHSIDIWYLIKTCLRQKRMALAITSRRMCILPERK